MSEFDSPWKEALNHFLRPFLQLFFQDIERLIDWSVPPEALDSELAKLFPDGAFGKKFVDRLFKVRLLDQSELWLLIHIEVQTQFEKGFEERMFRYFIRLKEMFGLPLTCLAVIADEVPVGVPRRMKSSAREPKSSSRIRSSSLPIIEIRLRNWSVPRIYSP